MSFAPATLRATRLASPAWMGRTQAWLAAMLFALHAGTAWDVEAGWAKGFMLAHFGLFLLWQPLWRGEREVSVRHAALVAAAGVGLAATLGWWLLALWLALMFGLLGGRATGTSDRRTRMTLLIAAAYVLALLFAWVVPHLFSAWQPEEALAPSVRYGLPLLPLAILFIRPSSAAADRDTVAIDLFYAVLLFLAVVVLVLGTFVLKDLSQGHYAYALMQMLFALALLLAALSWLWNPHAGYAGLEQLLSRYVAGIGLPFERWVARLAELAAAEPGADAFVRHAAGALVTTAGLAGLQWRHGSAEVSCGSTGPHCIEYEIRGQHYALYLRARPGAGMVLHLKLLAEVLAYFYEAKEREERERRAAYDRAIHEAGARLTHDVKNLLQGLRALCAAADESAPDEDAALLALFRRQLPAITGRVNATLDKLRAPAAASDTFVPARQWWEHLKQRHANRAVSFECSPVADDLLVPAELFDGAAENLIGNAMCKDEGTARVTVRFGAGGNAVLEVSDDGTPVPEPVARELLRGPVPSSQGLGIGLYHCASHAARLGYRLTLASNERGAVRFVLAPA